MRLGPNGEPVNDPVIGSGFGSSPNGGFSSIEHGRAAALDASRNAIYIAGDIDTLNGVAVPEIFKLTYASAGGDVLDLTIVAEPQDIEGEAGETVALSVGAVGGGICLSSGIRTTSSYPAKPAVASA